MAKPKIVLAYSGGLDTTVAVPWLQEKYDADIITLTIDLGMVDLESIRQRALSIGATEALTVDGRDTLVNEFLFPSLQAGTVYEEQYPLATALGRPLIARYLVEAAKEGDREAINTLSGCVDRFVRLFRGNLSRSVRRAYGSTIDFVCEGLAEAMSKLEDFEYRSDEEFYAWAARHIRSRIVSAGRHGGRSEVRPTLPKVRPSAKKGVYPVRVPSTA